MFDRVFNTWHSSQDAVTRGLSRLVAGPFYALRGVVVPVSHEVKPEGVELTVLVTNGHVSEALRALELVNERARSQGA
jgi:hypothetical protein